MNSLQIADTILYVTSNLFRVYVLYRFMHIFFKSEKCLRRTELLFFAGYYVLNTGTYLVFQNPLLNIVTNVIPFFIITFLFNSKISTKILSTIIVYALSMVVEIIVYFPLEAISSGVPVEAIIGIISDLLLFLVSIIAGRVSQKNGKEELTSRIWLIMLTIPIGSIFVAAVLALAGNQTVWISVSACFLLGINFMTFYLYEIMIRHYVEEREQKLLVQQNQAYIRQFDLIEKTSQNERILRHDLKNQLYSIRVLINNGEQKKALQYLDSMDSFVISDARHVNTGNPYVDSMLNYKIAEAIGLGITVDREILIPSKIPVDLFDLNVIIGNLFDNAIEASAQSQEKNIQFAMRVDNSTLSIKVENTFLGERTFVNGTYYTTKEDKATHGFGLKSIQNMVEKYDGTMKITTENNHFAVIIMLYLINQE